jgi:hypothetical protein
MSTGEWSEREEPDIAARHLLLCREVTWNSADTEARYSLLGLFTDIRPKGTFPLVWDRPLYTFVQFFGSPGEYEVWIELVRLVQDETGEILDETEAVVFGPFDLKIATPFFIHGRSFYLKTVPFDAPGLFEFRIRVAGVYDVLVTERLFVEG